MKNFNAKLPQNQKTTPKSENHPEMLLWLRLWFHTGMTARSPGARNQHLCWGIPTQSLRMLLQAAVDTLKTAFLVPIWARTSFPFAASCFQCCLEQVVQ